MRSSLAKSPSQTHLKTVEEKLSGIKPAMASASMEPKSAALVDDARDALDLIVRAIHQAGLSQKAAAITAETKDSEFSLALRGQGRFSWLWLWKQDDAFWQAFWPAVATAKRISAPNRKRLALKRVMDAMGQLILELEDRDGSE